MLWGREEEGKETNEMNQQRVSQEGMFSVLVPEDLCIYVSSVCGDVFINQVTISSILKLV